LYNTRERGVSDLAVVASDAYKQAGVDIDAGARAVSLMRSAVRSTFGPRVLADIGHFGGLYALDDEGADDTSNTGQVLVASADGVGTKLKLAFALGTHRKIGQDIVNHCINDILACGARPFFFLDYIATGKVVPEQIAEVVAGMADACRAAGCALLGGETAEMPGMYHDGEYDVAGFIVGGVRRDKLILGKSIVPGDVVLALPSNGLHTNGYTLARKVLGLDTDLAQARERLSTYEGTLNCTLGEALTRPHRSYLAEIAPLLDMEKRPIKGLAHITGGGLLDNIPRVLPEGCAVRLDTTTWPVPPIFGMIQERGGVSDGEMARVFNMGLGMVMVVAPEHVQLVKSHVPEMMEVGKVVRQEGDERVTLLGGGIETDYA
jgi:phosphoribosylformylglycinamidine cyclo-ligase